MTEAFSFPQLNEALLKETRLVIEELAALDRRYYVYDDQDAKPALMKAMNEHRAWTQGSWRCNTGMCFAGHAATLQGRKWARPTVNDDCLVEAVEGDPEEHIYTITRWNPKTTNYEDVQAIEVSKAAELDLGLTSREAHSLFSGDNRIDDIRQITDRLLEGRRYE